MHQLSYSTLSRDHEGLGFYPKISQFSIYFLVVITELIRDSQVQKCLRINPKPFYHVATELQKYIYLLVWLLMPSEKHNSRITEVTGLISLLINAASFHDLPFHLRTTAATKLATFILLWVLFFSSLYHIGDNLW